MTLKTTRRTVLLAGTAASATSACRGSPRAPPEFQLKYANNSPVTHPLTVRTMEAMERIKKETNGRVEIQVFPNNQLGSDTDMLSQLRSGAIEFFTLSGLILSTLVPVASINGLGFIWEDYDKVWPAMDGELGAYIRGADRQVRPRRDGEAVRQRLPPDDVVDAADQDARTTSRASRSASRRARCGPRCSRRSTPRRCRSISRRSIRRCRPRSPRGRRTRSRSSSSRSCSRCRSISPRPTTCGTASGSSRTARCGTACRPTCATSSPRTSTQSAIDAARGHRQAERHLQGRPHRQGHGVHRRSIRSRSAPSCEAAGFYKEWKGKYGDEAWAVLEKYTGTIA